MKSSRKNFALCYFNKKKKFEFASNLTSFGILQFNKAKCVRNFEFLLRLSSKGVQIEQDEIALFKSIAIDQIIDFTRIVLCFENYFKAFLLVNNFVVHKIKSNQEFKDISNEQKDRPISIVELTNLKDFTLDRSKNQFFHSGLTKITLQISKMLSKEYQLILQVPNYVINPLMKINRYRNNIHFFLEEKGDFSLEYCQEIGNLIKYVDQVIKPNLEKMESELREIAKSGERAKSIIFKPDLESRDIFNLTRRTVIWEDDWIHIGANENIKIEELKRILEEFFNGCDYLFIKRGRKNSIKINQVDLVDKLLLLLGKEEFEIWGDKFKEVIRFKNIGVMNKGHSL